MMFIGIDITQQVRKAVVLGVLTLALAVVAGCAGMAASMKYKEEATNNHIFTMTADALLKEAASYLSPGGFVQVEIDQAKLTAATPWMASRSSAGTSERKLAQVTKVDDSRSKLAIFVQKQAPNQKTVQREIISSERAWYLEYEVIKRVDRQKAAAIEAGAKNAAAEAKK